MQAILNANFHFDGGVKLGVSAQRVDHNVQLLGDVIESSDQRGPKEIPARTTNNENRLFCCLFIAWGDKSLLLGCEHMTDGLKSDKLTVWEESMINPTLV